MQYTTLLLRSVLLVVLAILAACQHGNSQAYVLNAVYRLKVDAIGSKVDFAVYPKSNSVDGIYARIDRRADTDPDLYRVRKGALIRVMEIRAGKDFPYIVTGRFESGPEKGRRFEMRYFEN